MKSSIEEKVEKKSLSSFDEEFIARVARGGRKSIMQFEQSHRMFHYDTDNATLITNSW